MSDVPQISCILTAFNAERYLCAALDSILAQTGADFELIVVDDGSTDGTAALAESYGDKLRLVRQSNMGQPLARNTGLSLARGEFVAFMDADDLCTANRFALQLQVFAEDPTLDLCAAHIQNFEGDMQLVGEPIAGYNIDMMLRRSLFERIGLFTDGLFHASRLEWMLRARQAKVKERLLPDVVIYRRLHGENMSTVQAGQSLREHLHVLHGFIKRPRQGG
jgi:glycosyltransferase involved in cell wall biosynthesis